MINRARNVAIGCIIMTGVSIGSYMALPVYLLPVSTMLGVTIGQLSLLFSFTGLVSLLTSLFLGKLFRVLRVKTLITLAGITFCIFFVSISTAQSIISIYIGALLFGFASVASGYGVSQTEITWWFPKNTGKVMSLLSIGVGIMAFIISPVAAQCITVWGVRTVALAHGIIVGAVIVFMGLALISENPSKYQIESNVSSEPSSDDESSNGVESASTMSVSKILKTAPFWLMLIAAVLSAIGMTGFTNNASTFYQSIGLDSLQAAFCISAFNLAALAWAPFYGFLVDRFGPSVATTICLSVAAIALVAAIFIVGFVWALVFALIVGVLNMVGMLGPLTYSRIYGAKEAGYLIGFATAGGATGAMLGAPIAGFIFDATGSFNPYMITAAGFFVVCIILTVVSVGLARKKRYFSN